MWRKMDGEYVKECKYDVSEVQWNCLMCVIDIPVGEEGRMVQKQYLER